MSPIMQELFEENSIIAFKGKNEKSDPCSPHVTCISFVDSSKNIEYSVTQSLESSNRVVIQFASFVAEITFSQERSPTIFSEEQLLVQNTLFN